MAGNYYASKHFQERNKAYRKRIQEGEEPRKPKKPRSNVNPQASTSTLENPQPSTSTAVVPVRNLPNLNLEVPVPQYERIAGVLAVGEDNISATTGAIRKIAATTRAAIAKTKSAKGARSLIKSSDKAKQNLLLKRKFDKLVQDTVGELDDFNIREETEIEKRFHNREATSNIPIEDNLNGLRPDVQQTPAITQAQELKEIEEAELLDNNNNLSQELRDENEPEPGPSTSTANMDNNIAMDITERSAQNTAGGSSGSGAAMAAGGNTGANHVFIKHRMRCEPLKHLGNNIYVSQRVFKYEINCKDVEESMTWNNVAAEHANIQLLFNSQKTKEFVKYADLKGSVGFNNLQLNMYIDGPGMSEIFEDNHNWEIISTKGKLVNAEAFEMVKQYNGDTVVGYIHTPCPTGKLLGHIYYPDPTGKEMMKCVFKNNQEYESLDHIIGETWGEDTSKHKITTESMEMRTLIDYRQMTHMPRCNLSGDKRSLEMIVTRPSKNVTNLAPFGVSLPKCMKTRTEFQSGMNDLTLWALPSGVIIDKRAYKGMAYHKNHNQGFQMTSGYSAESSDMTNFTNSTRTNTYVPQKDRYTKGKVTSKDNVTEGDTLVYEAAEKPYVTPIFIMPYRNVIRNSVQDIVMTFDVVYQILIKKWYTHIIDDYYFHNIAGMSVYTEQKGYWKEPLVTEKIRKWKTNTKLRRSNFSTAPPTLQLGIKTTDVDQRANLPILKTAIINVPR